MAEAGTVSVDVSFGVDVVYRQPQPLKESIVTGGTVRGEWQDRVRKKVTSI